ncbi:pyridoxamine 5'-phosphate oxidase family protein [Aquihabitans daechungensis]|uniref:pyridoxamine 5'-phosphate oxidase family protein n=1 Tax=Aquihabitans daechungensis TaxID=1052257 RepID=UPI003B9F1542
MSEPLAQTDRTKLRRIAERGSFDRALANSIIDEAYLAHVGFVVGGAPKVLPMTYGRDGDVLYLHGAVGNAMLRASAGAEVCVTITLLDGLVMARSAFHHSMNYRSVVLLGVPERVDDEAEKRRAFDVIVDHVLPGRTEAARPTNASELRTTLVLRLAIDEGSAKVRTGGAVDDEEDHDREVWAGVIPLRLTPGEPEQDALQLDVPALRRLDAPVPTRPGSLS